MMPKHRKQAVHDLEQLDKWFVMLDRSYDVMEGIFNKAPESIHYIPNAEIFVEQAKVSIGTFFHGIGICRTDIGKALLILNSEGEMSIHEEDYDDISP